MPYYLVEASYSPAAMAAMVQSPEDRPRVVTAILDKLGGRLEQFWLAFGDYDVIAICQMPDEESMAAFSMAVAAGGGVRQIRTTPLLAWPQGMNALRRAGDVGYTPPGGACR